MERLKKECGCCYSAILMDCEMPVLNGFEAANILTEKMVKNEIPFIQIVACTAHAMDEDLEKCKKNGMYMQLLKPVSIARIDEIIRKLQLT